MKTTILYMTDKNIQTIIIDNCRDVHVYGDKVVLHNPSENLNVAVYMNDKITFECDKLLLPKERIEKITMESNLSEDKE